MDLQKQSVLVGTVGVIYPAIDSQSRSVRWMEVVDGNDSVNFSALTFFLKNISNGLEIGLSRK